MDITNSLIRESLEPSYGTVDDVDFDALGAEPEIRVRRIPHLPHVAKKRKSITILPIERKTVDGKPIREEAFTDAQMEVLAMALERRSSARKSKIDKKFHPFVNAIHTESLDEFAQKLNGILTSKAGNGDSRPRYSRATPAIEKIWELAQKITATEKHIGRKQFTYLISDKSDCAQRAIGTKDCLYHMHLSHFGHESTLVKAKMDDDGRIIVINSQILEPHKIICINGENLNPGEMYFIQDPEEAGSFVYKAGDIYKPPTQPHGIPHAGRVLFEIKTSSL